MVDFANQCHVTYHIIEIGILWCSNMTCRMNLNKRPQSTKSLDKLARLMNSATTAFSWTLSCQQYQKFCHVSLFVVHYHVNKPCGPHFTWSNQPSARVTCRAIANNKHACKTYPILKRHIVDGRYTTAAFSGVRHHPTVADGVSDTILITNERRSSRCRWSDLNILAPLCY